MTENVDGAERERVTEGSVREEAERAKELGERMRGQVEHQKALAQEMGAAADELTRLSDALAAERKRMEILATVVMALNAEANLPDLMDTAVRRETEVLGGDSGVLLLFEPDGRHLRCARELWAGEIAGTVVDVEDLPNLKRAVESRKPIYVPQEASQGQEAYWLDRLGLAAILAVPLVAVGSRLGFVLIMFREGGRVPSSQDVAFAEVLGGQCALAIDRARARSIAESERALFRTVLQQMPNGVVVADAPSGKVVLTNESAKRIWHVSTFEGTLNDYAQFKGFHPDGQPYQIEEWPLSRALLKGEVVTDEEISFVADDSCGTVSVGAAPIRDESGRVVNGVVVFQDISERKQAELERERLLAQLDAVIDSMPDFLTIFDPSGNILRTNATAEALLGYSSGVCELPMAQRLQVLDVRRADGQQFATEELPVTRALRGETVRGVTVVMRPPTGKTIWTSISAAPIHARDGRMLGAVVTGADMTERRQAELERERLLAVLDATIASIPDALIVYNPAGEIVRMNSAADKMFGYSDQLRATPSVERWTLLRFETLDGQPFPLDSLPAVRALNGETVLGVALVLHPPTGKTVAVSSSAAPITGADGRVLGAVLIVTDVTQQQRLTKQREDFVNMISHDLRAPLTIIKGQAQALERFADASGLPEQGLRSVRSIVTGTRRMNAMIQDLVDAARIESGQLPVNARALDVRAFILDLKERLAAAEGGERIQIHASAPLPETLADPDRLERVLMNLMGNALKYSPPESPVLVTVESRDGEVLIAVSDRGQGIPSEMLPRLFERYYRTSLARQQKEGLGLGLFITKGLVEAQRGRIWVESAVGKGSTFYFTLPALAGEGRKPPANPGPEAGRSP